MSVQEQSVKNSPNTVPLSESSQWTVIGLSIACTWIKISGRPPHSAFFSIAFKLLSEEPYSSSFHKYSRPRSSPWFLANWVLKYSISTAFNRSWWADLLSNSACFQSSSKSKCQICTLSIAAQRTNMWTKLWCYCLLKFWDFSSQS